MMGQTSNSQSQIEVNRPFRHEIDAAKAYDLAIRNIKANLQTQISPSEPAPNPLSFAKNEFLIRAKSEEIVSLVNFFHFFHFFQNRYQHLALEIRLLI